jgi:hypothetical protein
MQETGLLQSFISLSRISDEVTNRSGRSMSLNLSAILRQRVVQRLFGT